MFNFHHLTFTSVIKKSKVKVQTAILSQSYYIKILFQRFFYRMNTRKHHCRRVHLSQFETWYKLVSTIQHFLCHCFAILQHLLLIDLEILRLCLHWQQCFTVINRSV